MPSSVPSVLVLVAGELHRDIGDARAGDTGPNFARDRAAGINTLQDASSDVADADDVADVNGDIESPRQRREFR